MRLHSMRMSVPSSREALPIKALISNLWRFFRTSGIRKGEQGFEVSNIIEQLTGQRPQTLDEFFRLNADSFGGVGQPA